MSVLSADLSHILRFRPYVDKTEMENLGSMIKHSLANISLIPNIFEHKLSAANQKEEHLNPNRVALKEAMSKCRREIKKSKRWNALPSPVCFEHAAMLSRQNKSYQTEVKICQLYISLVDKCVSRRTFNKKKFERKAQSLRQPFSTRLQSIAQLDTSEGVNVQHIALKKNHSKRKPAAV